MSNKKPIGVVLPTWNPNEPRFVIEEATKYTENSRVFKNGKCIYNQRLGFAYSIEEVVDVLNELGEKIDDLQKEVQLKDCLIQQLKNSTDID